MVLVRKYIDKNVYKLNNVLGCVFIVFIRYIFLNSGFICLLFNLFIENLYVYLLEINR